MGWGKDNNVKSHGKGAPEFGKKKPPKAPAFGARKSSAPARSDRGHDRAEKREEKNNIKYGAKEFGKSGWGRP